MQLPTFGQITAFGGHVVTFGAGVVSALAVTHIATPDQAQSATTAITQISQGVALIVSGGSTLIAFASAIWAVVKVSIRSQIASVQGHDDLQVTSSNPKRTAGIPGVKIGPVK